MLAIGIRIAPSGDKCVNRVDNRCNAGDHQITIGCGQLFPSAIFAFELLYDILIKSENLWHDGIGCIAAFVYG